MCKRELDEVNSDIAETKENRKACANDTAQFENKITQLLEEKKVTYFWFIDLQLLFRSWSLNKKLSCSKLWMRK
jgi:hypothetical protein